MAVRQALMAVDGVSVADVSYEKARADVTYDPDRTNIEALIAAVDETGFQASLAE